MVKICQTGLLKLNFEIMAKNTFSGFGQKFRRPWMKFKIFFCHFPNPWTLRVSGMGGYTSKCEKSQNHCTLLHSHILGFLIYEKQNKYLTMRRPLLVIYDFAIDPFWIYLYMRKILFSFLSVFLLCMLLHQLPRKPSTQRI